MMGSMRHEVVVNTTPKELRAIADRMAAQWPRLLPGDSTRAHTWYLGDSCVVNLHFDQAAMNMKMQRGAE